MLLVNVIFVVGTTAYAIKYSFSAILTVVIKKV